MAMGKPGTLYKITLKDFVTYTNIEVFFGPHINMIIGANGTGKSTICAGMILGLGGTPRTIGRATRVSEYVKHGCTEARIDIELYGTKPGQMITITRKINVSNRTVWLINNNTTTEDEVKKTVEKLNIQVDNLCQFLPQDRVQDFSKMDKLELLVNTEKAIGRQDLVEKHNQLIDSRKNELDMINAADKVEKKVNQIKVNISRMEEKVQNLQEKRQIQKEIADIKRKISWANYAKALRAKEEIENDKKDAEKMLSIHKKKIQPLETKVAGMKNEMKSMESNLKEIKNELRGALKYNIKKLLEESENIEHSHRQVIQETKMKIRALQEFKTELDVMRAKVDKLKNDESGLLAKYGEEKEILRRVDKCKYTENALKTELEEMDEPRLKAISVLKRTQSQADQLEDRIQSMENVKEQRLQMLKSKDRDAYDALMWLRENHGRFRGKIYEPIMIELNVADPDHCKYIENIIPFRDRVAFTCELQEDMNLFLETVGPNWRVNVLHSGAEHPGLDCYQSDIPINDLHQFGFFSYAISLVTGPEPIMKYLCRMYGLQNIPIGNNKVADHVENIPSEIRLFFSDTQRFAISKSRYTNQKSTRISSVDSDCTFSLATDKNAIREVRKELHDFQVAANKIREKIKAYETQQSALENKRSEAIKERNNLLMHIEHMQMLQERRRNTEQSLEQRIRDYKSEEKFKEEANKRIQNILTEGIRLQQTTQSAINEYGDARMKCSTLKRSVTAMYAQIANLENQHSDVIEEYKQAVQTMTTINSHLQDAVSEVKSSLQAAKKLSKNFMPEDTGFDQFRESFEKLPSQLEALNVLALEKQTQIECMLSADDGEIKEYEDNLVEVRRLEKLVNDYNEKLQNERNGVEALREQWINPLQELVQQINRNFSEFFASMSCCGEVDLTFADKEDYRSYGLTIRVKFRKEEELHELDRFRQSGGERAVSTALYLLAMQDLSAAPFRCVDEINQGMDPQNERRVLEILMQVASEGGQYFLITPKLLPKLKHGPNIKVHIIHNGPFCYGNE